MSIAITTMQVITTATTSVATIRITRTPKKMRMRKMMMKTKADSSQGDAQANELAVANGRDGISTQALVRHDGRAYEVHPEVSSYTRMVEPVCRGPSRRGTASICAGGPSYRQGSACQKISASPERPALGMCVTLQSPPGLRIGLLAERRCREKVGMEKSIPTLPYFCLASR